MKEKMRKKKPKIRRIRVEHVYSNGTLVDDLAANLGRGRVRGKNKEYQLPKMSRKNRTRDGEKGEKRMATKKGPASLYP